MSVQVTADPYELRDLAPLPEYESHVAELDKILLSEVDYPEVAKTPIFYPFFPIFRPFSASGRQESREHGHKSRGKREKIEKKRRK